MQEIIHVMTDTQIAQTTLSKYDLPPTPPFLRGDYIEGAFTEGTLTTRFGTRIVMLPTELVLGLHRAIEYETGRAWKIVAYTCGRKWGERLLRRLKHEWREQNHQQLEHLEYHIFESWLIEYFRFCGWGELDIDFSMEAQGLVLFHLQDSVLDRILEDFDDDFVNEIFAGVFASMVTWLASRELDCIEIDSPRTGAEHSRFVVGLPEHIAAARRQREAGDGADALIETMRVDT